MSPFLSVLSAYRMGVRARRFVRGPLFPGWDDNVEAFAGMMRSGANQIARMPYNAQRQATETLIRQLPRSPKPPGARRDLVDASGVPAEWLTFESAGDAVILFLHGGGYGIGSPRMYRDLAGRLGHAADARVLSIDYRLTPEHRFPAQLEDAVSVYRFLLDDGVPPRSIVIVGDSAGGGLTLSTLVRLRQLEQPLPAAAICLSPWADLEMGARTIEANARYDYINKSILKTFAARFVSPSDLRNPLAAPIHADFTGLPPLLIQAGELEVLLDDSRTVAERARAAGVDVTLEVYDGMIHVCQLYVAALPIAKKAIASAGQFAKQHANRRISVAGAG